MSAPNVTDLESPVTGRSSESRPCHFRGLSQDDRLRKLFGLPADAPLPSVSEETLAIYYDHLMDHLAFPFEAMYCQSGGKMRQLIRYVRIMDLVVPRLGGRNLHGLLCTAEDHKETVEVALSEFGVFENHPNCQLIDDYAYWFVNYR